MRKAFQPLLPAILLVAMPLAFGAAPTPAAAKAAPGSTEPVRVLVSHDDLDLTGDAGIAALERRIQSAEKTACPAMTRSLREIAHARACRKTAAANAKTQSEIAIATARAGRAQFASNDDKAVAAQ